MGAWINEISVGFPWSAAAVGPLIYKGTFAPSWGTYPATPATGDIYIASDAGTVSGTEYAIGDRAVYNGTTRDKIDNSETPLPFATSWEVDTGTSTTKVISPDALAGSIHGLKQIQLKICDDATAPTTGDGKIIFMIPTALNGMNLVSAHAAVTTVSSSGTPTVQIRNVTDAVDMLSTRITIDINETTSYTAATPPVIDSTKDDVATGDLIAIDVDVAGTWAKGLIVYLAFQTP